MKRVLVKSNRIGAILALFYIVENYTKQVYHFYNGYK